MQREAGRLRAQIPHADVENGRGHIANTARTDAVGQQPPMELLDSPRVPADEQLGQLLGGDGEALEVPSAQGDSVAKPLDSLIRLEPGNDCRHRGALAVGNLQRNEDGDDLNCGDLHACLSLSMGHYRCHPGTELTPGLLGLPAGVHASQRVRAQSGSGRGRTSSGPSFPTLFTASLIGYASISSSGQGPSMSCRVARSCSSGSSHSSTASSSSMTGMRLWSGSMTALGPVVMMHALATSPPCFGS